MKRLYWLGPVCLMLVSLFVLLGCEGRPEVPTVAVEPTQPVVVIVVTATSQPTLVPTSTSPAPEATITPIPTFTPVVTATAAQTAKPTAATQVTRAATTPEVQVIATTAVTASAPATEQAPTAFGTAAVFAPEGKAFRDGDTVKFEFGSVGPLAPDQCYRIDMTLGNPTGPGGVGDWWVPRDLCGNPSAAGDHLVFELKPGRFREDANYGTLLVDADSVIPPTPEYTMNWFVTVVKLIDSNDPIHPNVQPISPASGSLQNSFFR